MNGGRPDTTNPCLVSQLAWAAGTAGVAAGTPIPLYVNTANPGTDGSSWPTSNSRSGQEVANPYGMCDGASNAACAYTYGYAMAFDDANLRGVPDPAHHFWWLDVETGNSWSPDTATNTADLEGMTAYLESIGAEVGIYSTAYQFGEIAGSIEPGSNLNRLKNWIPGAASTASAQANCASDPLTPGGTIALTQFTSGSLDYNVSCPAIPSAPPTPQTLPETTPSHSPAQPSDPANAPPRAQSPQVPQVPHTVRNIN